MLRKTKRLIRERFAHRFCAANEFRSCGERARISLALCEEWGQPADGQRSIRV
jgi:hypothetical protein